MTDWSEHEFATPLDLIEAVKQTVTMPEIVELTGFDLEDGDKVRPPWNETERTSSCHIYEDHFHDYSTGRWGDMIDWVRLVTDTPDAKPGAIARKLWNKALRVGKEPGDVEVQQPRELVDFTDRITEEEAVNPVHTSEVAGVQVTGFGIVTALSGDVLVPHREPGRVYGVKVRQADGRKSSWPGSQFAHRLYCPHGWPEHWGPGISDLVICEGESDAWALDSLRRPARVLALPSGSSCWKDHWLEDLRDYDTVWVCMDNDQAGQNARSKIMSKVGYDRAKELRVPALYNDARDAALAGWRPEL